MFPQSWLEYLHTRDHVSRIECIVILNEAEAVHEFDLGDSARSVLEVALNIFFGDCRPDMVVSRVPEGQQHSRQ